MTITIGRYCGRVVKTLAIGAEDPRFKPHARSLYTDFVHPNLGKVKVVRKRSGAPPHLCCQYKLAHFLTLPLAM